MGPRAHAPQQEKTPNNAAHMLQLEKSPHSLQLEKAVSSNKDLAQSLINKYINKIFSKINKYNKIDKFPQLTTHLLGNHLSFRP